MSKDNKSFSKLLEKAIVDPGSLNLVECCILDRDLDVSAEALIASCTAIKLPVEETSEDPNKWVSNLKIKELLKKAILWPGNLTLSECIWIEDFLEVKLENFSNNIIPEEIDILDEKLFGPIDDRGVVYVDVDL